VRREIAEHGRSLHEAQPSRNIRVSRRRARPWRSAGPAALAGFAGPA
jgi:hypothetical protein